MLLDALSALVFRARLEKKDGGDWRGLVQAESLKIHSTGNSSFQLSDFSLASAGSNVSAEEVPAILAAFGISGGWTVLKKVSDSIGGGLPDLSQAYKNASSRRHSCAHEANFNYSFIWLDVVLEARCRQVESSLSINVQDHNIDAALNYRFLHDVAGVHKESKAIGGRTIKNWHDQSEALRVLLPRLRPAQEFLILLDSGRRISDWYVS